MIETNQKLVFNDHVIEIGRGQEYGYVRVHVDNDAFKVTVHDQFDRVLNESVYPIKRNLTPDELAFMDAYSTNVSTAPPNVVEDYLRMENCDEFYDKYGGEYYSGLADAWGMWEDAKRYYTEAK